MVRAFRYIYGIMTVFLVLLIGLASIFSPDLLMSLPFVILYLLFALLCLVSLYYVSGTLRKLLQLFIALLIVGVVVEKSVNERYVIPMGEGGSYYLLLEDEVREFELIDFTITRGIKGRNTAHYESKLLIGQMDTVTVRVNHPYRYGHVRLYQSSYRKLIPFIFAYKDSVRLFEGQTGKLNEVPFEFIEFDAELQRAGIRYNQIFFYIPVGVTTPFLDGNISIFPSEPEIGSVLEYVGTKGQVFLIVLALLTLLTLIYYLYRRYR